MAQPLDTIDNALAFHSCGLEPSATYKGRFPQARRTSMAHDANSPIDRTAEAIRVLADSGWELRSEIGGFLHFARKKAVSMPLIVGGIILIPFHEVGILLIVVALLNYALAKEPVLVATREQLANGRTPASGRRGLSPLFTGLLAIAAFILAGDLIYRLLR